MRADALGIVRGCGRGRWRVFEKFDAVLGFEEGGGRGGGGVVSGALEEGVESAGGDVECFFD